MKISGRNRLIAVPLLLAFAASGCSRAPAGSGFGPRLAVTLRFKEAIKPEYYYYVLIRNAPDNEGRNLMNGPIPVTQAAAGNGFATDLHPLSGTAAFTDFVLFGGGGQPTISGYGLYHVRGYLHGDPNIPTNFGLPSELDSAVRPGNGDNTLTFELSLDRLRAASGECQTSVPNDCPTAKYLNINVVATTVLSVDPHNFDPRKYVDALGDQSSTSSGSFNKVLTIDTSLFGQIYQSSTNAGDPNYEPDNDSSPGPNDPAIELVAWQIQVKQ